MTTLPPALRLILGLFILAMFGLELLLLRRRQLQGYDWRESLASFVIAVGQRLIGVLAAALLWPLFAWVHGHRLFTVNVASPGGVIALFLGVEFFYYWEHRLSHRVRWLWATHSVHHSPERLNLSAAYRLGWTSLLSGIPLFLVPMMWLGFPPTAVLAMTALNLLYQFWLHTTWVPKLGWLEYVFNTPSAHRVHHASNVDYLDANYGGVLIVFDRLFGTYVEERADEPCRYGLVTPTTSRNPFVVEFEHWATLIRDVFTAKSVWIAINHVIQPPGWLPDGGGETTEELRRKGKAVSSAVETVNG